MRFHFPPRLRYARFFLWVSVLGVASLLAGSLTPSATLAEMPSAAPTDQFAGRTLEQALLLLQSRGLRILFSDRVVQPGMRVGSEPSAGTLREVLAELLRPHGLEAREGRGGLLVVVRASPGERDERPPKMPPEEHEEPPAGLPTTSERIEVHSEPPGILGEGISALTLDPLALASLPSLAEDPLRPLTRLPGTTGNDVSSEIRVRGSHADEVMIRLDGMEIPEPYHLRDFNNALSVLAADAVGQAELYTGGFPVEYGDRSSGVLDLTSREVRSRRRLELGLSPYQLEVSGAGPVADGRGSWLATGRAGSLKLAAEVAKLDKEPELADLFGKVDLHLTPSQTLRANLLLSEDELSSFEQGDTEIPDQERFRTRYGNRYGWLTHSALLGPSLFVETRGSWTRIRQDRRGFEVDPQTGHLELSDQRQVWVAAVGHDGEARLSPRHELEWGFETRWLDVDYDYASDFDLTDPLAAIRDRPAKGSLRFDRRLDGRQYGAYLADLFRPLPSLGVEVGVRFDENTLLDDDLVSPRIRLDARLGDRSTLRAAWGFFHQTQRVYELQVEDGETEFFPAERAEHRILGFEHRFGSEGAGSARPLTLRTELYERRIHDPRPRWENLFEPLTLTPELEADRVRIAPDSSRARGLEIVLSGGLGSRLDWSASYAWAEVEDRIDGRDVPRSVDQPHTVELRASWRTPWTWRFDFAWTYHTGWPTTPVTARLEDGDPVPVLGPLYGDRLPGYRRLDLGARRPFALPRGELEVYLDVQNVTAVDNLRGYGISFDQRPDGTVAVTREAKTWGPPIPAFGVRWRF